MNEGGVSLIRKACQHGAGKPDIYYFPDKDPKQLPTAQVATQEKHEVANGVVITTDGFTFSGKLVIDDQLNILMLNPKVSDGSELQTLMIKSDDGKDQKVDRILFHNVNVQRVYFLE